MTRLPHRGAHASLGLAMVAMAWPAAPRWLCLAMVVPAGAWFLGLVAARRRPADAHHATMAACMAWMATMPATHHMAGHAAGAAAGHAAGAGAGHAAGAAAGYFLLAAAPFLTAPWRARPRGPVLGPLGHAAMSLAMAVFLAAPLAAG